MLEAFKSLPEDPDELRAISVQMAQHIQSQAYQIENLKVVGSKSYSRNQKLQINQMLA